MEKLLIKDDIASESDAGSYAKSDSNEDKTDSDFDNIEMENFIADESENDSIDHPSPEDSKPPKKSKSEEDLTREELDTLAHLEGKRSLDADNYVDANQNRKLRKLKRIADGETDQKPASDFRKEEEFIVDDIGPTDDKDDYTLEIRGPAHTSETMKLISSIFGDISDFLQRRDHQVAEKGGEKRRKAKKSAEKRKEARRPRDLNVPRRLGGLRAFSSGQKEGESEAELVMAKEADFIYRKRFAPAQGAEAQEGVLRVLRLLHCEALEVPFIALYRRSAWKDAGLVEGDLWRVLSLAERFGVLTERLKKAHLLVEKAMSGNVRGKELVRAFLDDFAEGDGDIDAVAKYLRLLRQCSLDGPRSLAEAIDAVHLEEIPSQGLWQRIEAQQKSDNAESPLKLEKDGENDNENDGGKDGGKDGVKSLSKPARRGRLRFSLAMVSLLRRIGTASSLGAELQAALRNDRLAEEKLTFEAAAEVEEGELGGDGREERVAVKAREDLFDKLVEAAVREDEGLDSAEAAIQFAVNFLSREIGLHPLVQKTAEKLFFAYARISTKPTRKGRRDIDWMHPYLAVKKINAKPLTAFLRDFNPDSEAVLEQFCLLDDALKNGFITRTFDFESSKNSEDEKYGSMEAKLLRIYSESHGSERFPTLSQIRAKTVRKALEAHLLPHCQRAAHSRLLALSREHVAAQCCRALKTRWLSLRGVPAREAGVFAVAVGDFGEPSFCAVTNEGGLLIDYAKYNFLRVSTRRRAFGGADVGLAKKNEDLEHFKSLVLQHSPALVCVGASFNNCDALLADLQHVCSVTETRIRCELIRPELAQIFERSKRGRNEFAEYPPGLRNAVSLARLALDPLAELCYAAAGGAPNRDVLSLQLDAHQKLLPRPLLLRRLCEQVVSVISREGVDVNDGALHHPHKQGLLEFVPGLSPEMASFLVKNCPRPVPSREALRATLQKFPKIYRNCVAFLKIGPSSELPRTRLLDATRVHPELLPLAEKVLRFALEKAGEKVKAAPKAEAVHKLAKRAKKNLRVLIDFDAGECAARLKTSGEEDTDDLSYFVELVAKELKEPFGSDGQKDFKKITDEELFWLVTTESPKTLRAGQLVTPTVVSLGKHGVLCQMNCSVLGQIPLDNVLGWDQQTDSADAKLSLAKKKIKVGMTLKARITELCMERGKFSIVLDARKETVENSQMEDPQSIHYPRKLDRYLDLAADAREDLLEDEEPAQPAFIPRKIDFPFFKNLSREDAEKDLGAKDVGSLVVRPSSRGPNFLTATWKISRDPFICVNIEIREKNKPNSFSVGRLLEINRMQFEDLDEIYARFFERMTGKMKEMMNFRRFRFGTEEEVEKLVLFEKKETPGAVPYAFGFSLKHPGCLLLFYVFRVNAKKEYVVVVPQGYKFRGKLFSTPESLVQWFKRNPHTNAPFKEKRRPAPGEFGGDYGVREGRGYYAD